jgi:hypothetical protein
VTVVFKGFTSLTPLAFPTSAAHFTILSSRVEIRPIRSLARGKNINSLSATAIGAAFSHVWPLEVANIQWQVRLFQVTCGGKPPPPKGE